MNILEAIKKDLDKRRNELAEQEALNRRTGKFIDAAICAARESEARFSLNLIRDYLAFGKSFGFEPVKTSAAASNGPVEWRVAEKELKDDLFVILLGTTAFFCNEVSPGDKYIKLPDGVQSPLYSVDAPRWEKHDGEEANEPVFIRDDDMFVYYKGFRLNLDKVFGFLPKSE